MGIIQINLDVFLFLSRIRDIRRTHLLLVGNQEASMQIRQKSFSTLIILSMLMALCSACTGSVRKPEADLWGQWAYAGGEGDSSAYDGDLEFLQDGSLVITGQETMTYVIIAPGRMKVTASDHSEVLFYQLEDDTIRLIFDNGDILYTRVEDAIPVSQHTAVIQTDQVLINTATVMPTRTPMLVLATSSPTIQLDTSMPQPQNTAPSEPTATLSLGLGSSFTRDIDGMPMNYIPAGTFLMGSLKNDPSAFAHEKPQHEVFLNAFWMDVYEVSNAMFSKFVSETGYQTDAEKQGYSYMYDSSWNWTRVDGVSWRTPMGPGTYADADLPVVHVTYFDAEAYCYWVGARLPTEAEWEKAARGEDGRIFPWGNDFNSSYLHSDSSNGPVSVYLFPEGVSPYGIYNMAGNAFDWTSDWYRSDYYAISSRDNPTGPSGGEYRVVRGGSWNNSMKNVRSAHRDISMPELSNHLLGFRCAMDVD
jgi:formylglycine-generating enzyme required for sulfatase activity